jgi:hypothetical protein
MKTGTALRNVPLLAELECTNENETHQIPAFLVAR